MILWHNAKWDSAILFLISHRFSALRWFYTLKNGKTCYNENFLTEVNSIFTASSSLCIVFFVLLCNFHILGFFSSRRFFFKFFFCFSQMLNLFSSFEWKRIWYSCCTMLYRNGCGQLICLVNKYVVYVVHKFNIRVFMGYIRGVHF